MVLSTSNYSLNLDILGTLKTRERCEPHVLLEILLLARSLGVSCLSCESRLDLSLRQSVGCSTCTVLDARTK